MPRLRRDPRGDSRRDPSSLNAQTAEIDPAGAIPAGFSLAQGWEFTPTAISKAGPAPTTGTVTVAGGEASSGAATTGDPQFASADLGPAIPVTRDIVVDVKFKRTAGNTSNFVVFWADIGGGFDSARSVVVPGTTLNDGNYHVVRMTFTGQIGVRLDQLRIDPHMTSGATFAIDYVRVYTNGGLNWDMDIVSPARQGGGRAVGHRPHDILGRDHQCRLADLPAPRTRPSSRLPVGTVTIGAPGVAANVLSFPTANTTQATGYTLAADPGAP